MINPIPGEQEKTTDDLHFVVFIEFRLNGNVLVEIAGNPASFWCDFQHKVQITLSC